MASSVPRWQHPHSQRREQEQGFPPNSQPAGLLAGSGTDLAALVTSCAHMRCSFFQDTPFSGSCVSHLAHTDSPEASVPPRTPRPCCWHGGQMGPNQGHSTWQPLLLQRDLLEALLDLPQRRHCSSKVSPYFAHAPTLHCPERLWSLLLWRYSRPAWTRSCAACCR